MSVIQVMDMYLFNRLLNLEIQLISLKLLMMMVHLQLKQLI